MLQYSIDSVLNVQETAPTIIRCSGWLFDTKNAKTKIELKDFSSSGSQCDIIRTFRPDVKKLFKCKEERCGFELEITSNDPEKLEVVFSSETESVSIPLTELKPEMSKIEESLAIEWAVFLRKCALFFSFLFVLPIRLLKKMKDQLFRLSPGFQRFYFRYIYRFFNRNYIYNPSPKTKEAVPNPAWGEHILLFSHFADGSGAPVLALNIARELYGFGFNLHILLMRDGELHEKFNQFGTVDVINSETDLQNKLEQWQKEDIHIRKAFLNTTLTGIYAGILKDFNITVVSLIHEMPATITVMGQHEAASVLRKNADKIVLPSTLLQDLWEEADMPLPADRCIIFPQPDYHSDLEPLKDEKEKAVCHAKLCKELNIPEDSYIVIGCGMLETRKAPDVFFQTAFKVCEQNPKVHFVWIGDVGDQFYRKKINLMLEKFPENTRLLSYRNLNDYYRGADLFFLSSKEDPFPTVGLLAAKVAIPVVFCQRSTGLRDLFGCIEGCSSPEFSVDIFQKFISRLAADREFSVQQGMEFQKIYRDKMYTFRHYVQTLYELAGDKLPRITAIVPNYNYADFLPARIKTVADQTYPIYELLILDDCSKDNSAEVAEKLIKQYEGHFPGGIRYIPNTQNAGVFRQWYKGVSLAKGELIWIAEADDMCAKKMQSQLVHAFTDPEVQIAYAQSALIDKNDKVYSETFLQHTNQISGVKWLKNYLWDAKTEIETALAIKNTIPNASGALIRKTAFSKIPEELFTYRVIGDWFAYLHMVKGGKVAFCAEPLNLYRRHPGSVVAKNPELLVSELKKLHMHIQSNFDISDYTARMMQRELNQTCLMLKVSFQNQISGMDYSEESKPTEYWHLPDDVDWELFKSRISQSQASYLFVCLNNRKNSFPAHVAEAFKGSVHVFWHDDLGNSDAMDKFSLWENTIPEPN